MSKLLTAWRDFWRGFSDEDLVSALRKTVVESKYRRATLTSHEHRAFQAYLNRKVQHPEIERAIKAEEDARKSWSYPRRGGSP